MYLQRLIADDKIGFKYDYIGAAEYEFGATRKGRMALANAFLDGLLGSTCTSFVEVGYRGDEQAPIEVIVLALKQDRIDHIGKRMTIKRTKEAFHTDKSKIIGWMNVNPYGECEPLLIIRTSVLDLGFRTTTFLQPFVDDIKEERAEADNKKRLEEMHKLNAISARDWNLGIR